MEKAKNKKGFTLIELLAVIIILGVIMLIAIPSVTQQITNSRKNSYIDTASAYVSAVVVKVNEGSLPMFDTHRLYLIPVGNDDTVSCVSLESGGASPFSKYYNYAYVAVHYTGDSYDYWFLSEDGSLQGFEMTPTKTLETAKKDLVKSGMKTITELSKKYGTATPGTSGTTYSFDTSKDAYKTDQNLEAVYCTGTGCDSTKLSFWNSLAGSGVTDTSGDAAKKFKELTTGIKEGTTSIISSIEVFGAKKCREYFD